MVSVELQPSSSRPVEQVEENPHSKADIDLVESAEPVQAATYEESLAAHLPKAHRDYLLERHGTLELDPIPGMGPADPYNWPEWKVSKPSLASLEQASSFRRTKLTDHYTENGQPHPGSVSCLHGHIYRRRNHSRLRQHRRGTRSGPAEGQLLDLVADRHSGRCTAVLEATVQPFRPSSHLPSLPRLQSRM